MAAAQTLQDLFKRYRRPGDLVFAIAFLVFSAFLLSQIGNQTKWVDGTKLFTQPAFWPSVSLAAMTGFALLHLAGSFLSPRIDGRWREVGIWARSLEYALWFLLYVQIVPYAGYLPTTIVFAVLLALRAGYRSFRTLATSAVAGIVIVIVFKSFLQVKIPGGLIYEQLPDSMRSIMLTYF